MTENNLTPLIGMTLEDLQGVAARCGMPRFAAAQMARWLYTARVDDIDLMTDLSKAARARLKELGYTIGREAPLTEVVSADGTAKYLWGGS